MALFVDGPACTIEDLTDQDAGLLEVSLNTGINLSTKLRLAVEEIRSDLHLWLESPRPTLERIWGPLFHVEQVVVTPELRRWEAMHTLAMVYRDAYFSQLVDRYQAKWQEYGRLTADARDSFIASGVGLVRDPLSRAMPPLLTTTPGPQEGGTFYASVSWVNAVNQEGAASAASSLVVTDGNLMVVAATRAPKNAVGFNVYAGTALNGMFLQNDVMLPPGGTFLYVPGTTQGRLPGKGQKPDFVRLPGRTLLRG